jgi:hypothetical protein
MFSKPFLRFGCNLADISSFVQEKFDNLSLIMVHGKRTLHGFEGPDREDYFLKATQLNPI